MIADQDEPSGTTAATRHGNWLPLLLSGLVILGAVFLSTWLSDLANARYGIRGWYRYYLIPDPLARPVVLPSPTGFFTVKGEIYSGFFYYLGWYWAVALTGGYLHAVLWCRRAALRRGGTGPGRALIGIGAVAAMLALSLPLLARMVPALYQWWMRQVWVFGIPALLIVGVALAVTAWLRRSRSTAVVILVYTVLAALAGRLVLLPRPDPVLIWLFPAGPGQGLEAAALLNPLTALLLPALVLVIAGLVSFGRRRRGPSLDAAVQTVQ